MKKLVLTIAILLGIGITTYAAPYDGGLFKRGKTSDSYYYNNRDEDPPLFPGHNLPGNQNAPLGTGIAVLAGLGAAYLVAKKRKED